MAETNQSKKEQKKAPFRIQIEPPQSANVLDDNNAIKGHDSGKDSDDLGVVNIDGQRSSAAIYKQVHDALDGKQK